VAASSFDDVDSKRGSVGTAGESLTAGRDFIRALVVGLCCVPARKENKVLKRINLINRAFCKKNLLVLLYQVHPLKMGQFVSS